MAIRYDFYEVKEIHEEENEGKLRARAVSRGTISSEKLLRQIAQTSGFNAATTKGIMAAVTDSVLYYLGEGYSVQLDELGYLSVSLTSRKVKTRREIRAESVEFSRLNFRASRKVRKYLTNMEKEKVSTRRAQSSDLSHEKRARLLKDFLETHPFATRADYSRITSTLKNKAILDLNAFIEEGWLSKYGSGRTVVYLLNKQPM